VDRGWFKTWRKIKDSQVFHNEGLLKVWTWCLIKASHKTRWSTIKVGRTITEVEIHRGQFLFGRDVAAKELRMKPTTAYKRMLKLKKMRNIDINSNSNYSIVSICNYDTYQGDEDDKEQQREQAGDRQVTGKEQAGDTDKNKENKKNDQKEKSMSNSYPSDFILFWSAYPRKKSKGDAFKAWKSLNPTKALTDQMIAAVGRQQSWHDWKKDNGEYVPYPATWIRGAKWEDEDIGGSSTQPQTGRCAPNKFQPEGWKDL